MMCWTVVTELLAGKLSSQRLSCPLDFSAEDGIDTGGSTREFLRLCLHDSCLFEGKENKRFLALDYKALEKGMYENSGRIMAYSLVHRGPIPSFSSSSTVHRHKSGI